MDVGAIENVLRLGHTLSIIASTLEWAEYVDDEQQEPPEWPPLADNELGRGARFAIKNTRSLSRDIGEAQELAKEYLTGDLCRAVRETLMLVSQTLCQPDVPAEFVFQNGEEEEAVAICRNAMERAYNECGVALKRLSAAVLIEGDDACDAYNQAHGTENGERKAVAKRGPVKLSAAEQDLVGAIRAIGPDRDRSQRAIFDHLSTGQKIPSEGTTKTTLAALKRHGILVEDEKGQYALPEWQ